MDEKTSSEGKKLILVPDFFVFFKNLIGLTVFPFSKEIKYSFPSLNIVNSSFTERAFTTETPTPCNPPDTLYEFWSNFPPACSWVIITSAADFFSPLCKSVGIPLPSSSTVTDRFLCNVTVMFLQKPTIASSIELSTTSKTM